MTPRKWNLLFKTGEKLTSKEIINVLLKNRGVNNEKQRNDFLNPDLNKVTINTSGINKQEISKSLSRIKSAIENNEKIVVYGDYDVDGITGAAILWETIFAFNKNVIPYIPHRVEEGYGLSVKGIDHLLESDPDSKLIITVDNGIVANEAVIYAVKRGIDVIITDHHVGGKVLPKAFATVHTTKLCGAGVAWLLSREIRNSKFEIRNKSQNSNINDPNNHLELVALGTVADLVPLNSLNRALVKFGIEGLRKTKRPGLIALCQEAGIKRESIGTYEIGHMIAPRLNASGRIKHALDSLRLLCTNDRVRAEKLAKHISETNRDRQILTEESTIHANLISEEKVLGQKMIFVHNQNYNQGIIGLVASRLVEKHYKPSIVVSEGETYSKGSARSVTGFNIIEFLRGFSHMMVDAGGHPMAAGFTIETKKIELFKKALIKEAEKIKDKVLNRVLKIDLELDFEQLGEDLYLAIQKLAPFGMGNPEPVFATKKVKVIDWRKVGIDGKHLKLSLEKGGKIFGAIVFGAEKIPQMGETIDIAYSLHLNEWNGRRKIEMKIKDLRSS